LSNRSFSLITEPWIKVIESQTNQEKTVSLLELFENCQNYQQLAGEMRSQDLAILRLLLAILTTVYSRTDAKDNKYEWLYNSAKGLVIDKEAFIEDGGQESLFTTWQELYQSGRFSQGVKNYLEEHVTDFDFFGERPFYQATATDYDSLVPDKKKIITGNGQVLVKQINRQISESGSTPAIFAPKSGKIKNELPLDELVRWLITYQNFTGVTDKTKIVTEEKFSNPAGWTYQINPVFAKGKNFFQTLMLNLVLVDVRKENNIEYLLQKPVWEFESISDYVKRRTAQIQPDNLAELYTTWSRILHIEWEDEQPIIFSAGVPMFENENAFTEPMTTWRLNEKNKYQPVVKGLRSVDTAMWRNFGQYIRVRKTDDVHEPGIVVWLRELTQRKLIHLDSSVVLNSVALISDGNVTSQTPAVEVVDDMKMQADVLFDERLGERWPIRIEDAIMMTQKVGKDYYYFASDIGTIRNLDVRAFAGKMSAKFYARLNEPFKAWLEGLEGQDDRDAKILIWKKTLKKITSEAVEEDIRSSSLRDIKGVTTDHGQLNIFTAKSRLRTNLWKHLDLKREG